ncbi:RagB/SusD family nutrient uptake outer membrane protein [Odoribacter sp. AF15-53]|uniref:RagB/SusD family nutrient uptake outer membrane protein n=1 Tax=Odoribacter sp. AF15-53 TaxID=2292236 RepID=UPI000E53171C|nr:RagB/SusD family nutrient uptake outer membrane protein [Odoribacter sp. AF15-53]RHR78981.1 RagB/SusD family nutrient uptake outer membrane protein [Odoribacter sp. AF15-53]
MKTIIVNIVLCAMLCTVVACDSWLDTTPPSQVPEEDQFGDEFGFRQALIGCYIGMANENLYGKQLTWYSVDMQSGQYTLHSQGQVYAMGTYQYTAQRSLTVLNTVWQRAYSVIANANNALKFIDNRQDVLDPLSYRMIKGELLAIRGMLHFDMMRLYGYGNLANRTDKATKPTIPYVTVYDKEMTPQLSYDETIKLVIKDLTDALGLLDDEPITGKHPADYYEALNDDGFFSDRSFRLNYYAVKALLARVYMWEGSDASIALARQEALDVIRDGERLGLYRWITTDVVGTDPVHSTEHIASLNIPAFTDRLKDFYLYNFLEGTEYNAIKLSEGNMISIYEEEGDGENADYRREKLFFRNANGYYTPLKLAQDRSTGYLRLNRMPLIRLPEMYLIVAESYLKGASIDLNEAVSYLKTLREYRSNYIKIDGFTRDELLTCLMNEYRREFLCEGVTFFYFKRIGLTDIPGSTIVMDDGRYLWPYPAIEREMGRAQ